VATSVDLARKLVGLAGDDELAARSLLPIEGVTDGVLGFHAQQAAEKALKAVLAAKGIEFPFIHNLGHLSKLCKKSGIELPSTLDGVEDLTPFAVIERYGSEEPGPLDRDQALKWAAAAVAWARGVVEEAEGRRGAPTEPDPAQTPSSSA
jgi:HEPN domain-containing protein